jgi:glutamate-1-semialdehyde 2,1-aminomutase
VASFASQLEAAISKAGVSVEVPVVGPLVGLFFAEDPVTSYNAAKTAASNGRYSRFFESMLERGVALAPGPYEAMFPGFAHDQAILDSVVEAAAQSAEDIAATG